KIRFDIPKSINNKPVQLIIYDILGKEVARLVNENLKSGIYNVNWDASNYSRGNYLYQLKAEGFVETKKMLLVK
ncbi:MAG: T9SS type A sorting domain-containing protein, partial [Saprospiraceae bacterium]